MTRFERMPDCSVDELMHQVEKHLPFALNIARKFLRNAGANADQDEILTSVGLALCEAAKTYPTGHNTTFSTYCYRFIQTRLSRDFLGYGDAPAPLGDAESLAVEFSTPDESATFEAAAEEDAHRVTATRVQRRSLLLSSLRRLERHERQCIHHLFFEGRTLSEVEETGLASKQHLLKIRNALFENFRATLAEEQ